MQVKKLFRFIHLYIRYSCKFYSPKNRLTVGAKQIKAVGKIKKKKLLQVQIAQYQILKLEIGPIWSQSSHLLNPIRSLLRFVLYSDPRFLLLQWHSKYIYRTVSCQQPLSALMNCFQLVYGPLGQTNMHSTLDFCTDQQGRNRM